MGFTRTNFMRFLKFLARLILAWIAVGAIFILILGGLIAFDSISPAQRVEDFANVSFPGTGGAALQAYFARPDSPDPLPGILLVHEIYGLNESIKKEADLLAERGYAVLAVDAYRGKSTGLILRAGWLALTTPQAQIESDLDAGYSFLAGLRDVDPRRIGLVGFCFGGTQVLRLGTRNPSPVATVIFYGTGLPTDPVDLGQLGMGGPILGIFGADDRLIPLSQVFAFQEAMVERELRHRISIYPDVGHAFVTYESLFFPGPGQDAWDEMLDFLAEALK
jgi:carboxymethylenebutenolidase